MSGGFASDAGPGGRIKSSYVQGGSKLGTATAAALYIRDFMQHSRQKIRQPLALSDGGFCRARCSAAGRGFGGCSASVARREWKKAVEGMIFNRLFDFIWNYLVLFCYSTNSISTSSDSITPDHTSEYLNSSWPRSRHSS